MHISIHENVQPPLWHLSNQLKTVQSQSIFWIFILLQFCQFRVAYLSAVASLADSAGQPSVAARWLARPIPCPARQSQVWSPAQHHQPPTLLYISCIARRSCLPCPSPPAQLQAPTPSLKISTAPPEPLACCMQRWPQPFLLACLIYMRRQCPARFKADMKKRQAGLEPAIKRKYVIMAAGEKVQTSNSLRWRRSFTRKHIL